MQVEVEDHPRRLCDEERSGSEIYEHKCHYSVAIAVCNHSEEDFGLWHVYFGGSDLLSRGKKSLNNENKVRTQFLFCVFSGSNPLQKPHNDILNQNTLFLLPPSGQMLSLLQVRDID